ncbi:hypothetical protein IQ07DRAFT_520187 [Pyrenochaeta sp. DS3sAY3a]|nr:hypothetical protein IQ07DRAFT_520187 [Pyrenochaeta sp. DS3sAY3a]
MSTPSPSPPIMAVPMGFATQIKVLQESQLEQARHINNLTSKNVELEGITKITAKSVSKLNARILALEKHNKELRVQRIEAVRQLQTLRTLHKKLDYALDTRAQALKPDDLEGMLCIYGYSLNSVIGHQQHNVTKLEQKASEKQAYHVAPVGPAGYAYPPAYSPDGYCYAHGMPYHCQICCSPASQTPFQAYPY